MEVSPARYYRVVRSLPSGISNDNSSHYLALRNIFAIGGAFLAPRELIEAADWKTTCERGKASVAASAR
ncbi:hypothetical protein PY650_21540 [Rhizobium calliandrae]|uniref:Uncharacterized protein n=1 Tax=Rhizobium calliandrae TaxID=1312182 RepID=A0ABT7KJP5_9HYPH|nr:hypothetical protein [Rhizobium calliandrae]MDL2408183.1 hypothetical protein [Rhizobium calliandrae]